MSELHAKRSASEAAAVLAGPQAPAPPTAKRPLSLAGGALLVLLRCLGGILWIVSVVIAWPRLMRDVDLDGVSSGLVLGVFVAFEALWICSLALFAWALWRGSNRARMLAMCWAATSITASAINYFVSGAEITVRTTLLTLSLDILLLLALSSRDARAWTIGRRDARREHKRQLRRA
ncbi:hypothetical protein [Leucobacter japonicus]|uniref:hypothetical protein n=1 Tax=Leucobacter japonicus TaxID=1461259 RepID=UPI0006A793C1|nr:hypothetical protein [Leucobacter japonicus]